MRRQDPSALPTIARLLSAMPLVLAVAACDHGKISAGLSPDDSVRSGSGGSGDVQLAFDVKGWTLWDGNRCACCNTGGTEFKRDTVFWPNKLNPSDTMIVRRSVITQAECDDYPSGVTQGGGVVRVHTEIDGTQKLVAMFEADQGRSDHSVFHFQDKAAQLTARIHGEPNDGCSFRGISVNNGSVPGNPNPLYWQIDESNSGEVFRVYFECPASGSTSPGDDDDEPCQTRDCLY